MRFLTSKVLVAGSGIFVTQTATVTAAPSVYRKGTANKILAVVGADFCFGCGFICGSEIWDRNRKPRAAFRKTAELQSGYGSQVYTSLSA